MKFAEVALVFEELEKESKRLKITEALAALLKRATPEEAGIIAYLSGGSLNAVYVGTQFHFAEKSILKVIASVLHEDAATIKKQADTLGDLGLVVAQGLKDFAGSHTLSLLEVNEKLHQFLKISGTGSQDIKEQHLHELLSMLDPLSCKYVIRIILGKLRLGFSDMTLLDAFSWMHGGDKSIRQLLEDAYNISADIGLIVKTLKEEGVEGIEKISITPGIPIVPAAAERLSDAEAIVKKLGACVAQPKLDGFRLQIHIDKTGTKPLVRFFSRNLQDMSGMFPDLYQAVLDLPVQSFVGEGEAIAYDVETGSFLPFQETVKRKRKHDVEKVAQEFPLKLYLFDILYLDGKSLLTVPYHDRRNVLESLVDHPELKKHDMLVLIEEKMITQGDQLADYFNETVSVGLEGLVVKRPDAIYKPGKRNFNWIKLKRQETGSLDDTIDCVVLGYYFGHGKRAGFGIGALLVGIYNKNDDMFQTIAKIGTGLTDDEWREQKKSCDELKVKDKPHNVQCARELYPDVWASPQLVCMIRADEITRSPLHTAGKTEQELGFALRFPRLMGYRPDKSAAETTTVKEVAELFELQYSKKTKPKKEQEVSVTKEVNLTIG